MIHKSSYVEDCTIGESTIVWHFCHLFNSTIGRNCVIGQNVMIGPDVIVGNNCKIQNNLSLYKGVVVEDGVFIGPSAVFTNIINPRAFIERKLEFKKTLIKKGSSIGANATVVCGTIVGEYAFVGAGTVVTKDVPDYTIVVGNPAKVLRKINKEGDLLK